ncbi:MAG: hypothetical protein QNK37_10800 [Acidobacteriota bacterium]|nr:hypothetical protein [Acidobacteriota bacterium]
MENENTISLPGMLPGPFFKGVVFQKWGLFDLLRGVSFPENGIGSVLFHNFVLGREAFSACPVRPILGNTTPVDVLLGHFSGLEPPGRPSGVSDPGNGTTLGSRERFCSRDWCCLWRVQVDLFPGNGLFWLGKLCRCVKKLMVYREFLYFTA